ncbi:MAG: hypothetical protein JF597_32990 [Streptomyces sp.]|jgi:hypothetical protein|uniref:hypothetical protein n=1 Tax=Streptomyces sp. TaxID=1931 RepID=UPI0025EC2371|nr:hypothetical protein [Streptomyces sp.]MBW8798228.1 hypothetical protein [Streptomyces sp.]
MVESDRARGIEGWFWNEDVQPFMALLARYANYDFDGTDWQAVEVGLEATDDEHPDRWYSYPLVGSDHHLEVHLAKAVGGDEVSVRVAGTSNHELLLRADTLIAAFATRLVA